MSKVLAVTETYFGLFTGMPKLARTKIVYYEIVFKFDKFWSVV